MFHYKSILTVFTLSLFFNACNQKIDKKIQTDNLILSSGKITKVNKIIKYLCKVTNLKIIFKNKIKNNNKYIIGSNLKAKKLLNWSPKKNIYDVVNEYFK